METKTLKVLFKHVGSDAGTPREPHAAWEGQVNLMETKDAFVSSDNDQLIPVLLWEARKIKVPKWVTLNDLLNIRFMVRYKYYVGFGGDPAWGRSYFEDITQWREDERLAVIKLLKTKTFKSEFRKSLHERLKKWLDTKPEKRVYATPFSESQWHALLNPYTYREAKGLATSIYRNNEFPFEYERMDAETGKFTSEGR